jgi:hypothetical protein
MHVGARGKHRRVPPDTEAPRERVLDNAGTGSVVLVHFSQASTTAAAPGIIDALLAEGMSR